MKTLAIGVLASGRGSNFQAIIDAAESGYINASVVVLITDNPNAFAIERAKKHGIETLIMNPKLYASRTEYYHAVVRELRVREAGLVVLAGFMRIVGKPLVDAFRHRIMNIHPALLPSFPGLHGQRQAVEYGVKISGCTVHFVDEGMDTGPVIIQAAVPAFFGDTEDILSARILKLEHRIFPEAVRLFAENRLEVVGRKVTIHGLTAAEHALINPQIP
jgi:phosphoribosylglycinamide formyltransferase-1